ncbi:class I histocompatibility antigen, F10 alpha chain isoform X2 [Phascolarctos cinereus]|uniref:Class I histocompatibility antigen, F10 alpha chain-like n=1 Tax=Phascolarctos cinereus TaxID=38626 RepID=A0A6P5LFC1_PHACI|nr:class I histocompatibility antigen, F10 alpha chain-like [Phascolarctos cinereus]
MENQRRRKGSLTSWLLVLSVFALREYQIEGLRTTRAQEHTHMEKSPEKQASLQTHHRHECQFTAVGKTSLLDYTVLHVIDDVDVCSYDKQNKQFVVKESWMSLALGEEFIQHKKKVISESEMYFRLALTLLSRNDTKSDKNHTIQLFAGCELDNDIDIGSHIQFAMDGEDFMKINDQTNDWTAMKPEAEHLKSLAESNLGSKIREKNMKKYCFDMMRKILQYSSMKENVAPEVIVSRRDAPDGRVTFNCTATGFYPRSIQLHWEKDGQLGVWGQESSSGTLPNADSTFYLQISLELPPGDSDTGYTCVVEHSTLQTPAVYTVPEKPTVKRPWAMALGLLTVIILVLSCAGAFVIWKKKNTGHRTHEQATVDGEGTL